MSVYYRRKEQNELVEVVVNYDLIEIAPDYMTSKLVYLFIKPVDKIEDFESYFHQDPLIGELVSNDGAGYFAGARYIDDWVELYFYTRDSKLLRHLLKEKLPSGMQHDLGSNPDEEWRFFFDKLNPNVAQKREINNRHVVLDLLEEGDDLDLEHEFEHIFFCHTESQREKIKQELLTLGHTVEEETTDELLDRRFVLVTTHKGDAHIDTINLFSKQVTEIASKYHSLYDGWTTTLARPTE